MTLPPSDTPRKFEFLLNAMEAAGDGVNPAEQYYGDKRSAVLQHVATLERELQSLRAGVVEECAKVCEGLPQKNRIRPADRRSRMANLCAAEIRALQRGK